MENRDELKKILKKLLPADVSNDTIEIDLDFIAGGIQKGVDAIDIGWIMQRTGDPDLTAIQNLPAFVLSLASVIIQYQEKVVEQQLVHIETEQSQLREQRLLTVMLRYEKLEDNEKQLIAAAIRAEQHDDLIDLSIANYSEKEQTTLAGDIQFSPGDENTESKLLDYLKANGELSKDDQNRLLKSYASLKFKGQISDIGIECLMRSGCLTSLDLDTKAREVVAKKVTSQFTCNDQNPSVNVILEKARKLCFPEGKGPGDLCPGNDNSCLRLASIVSLSRIKYKPVKGQPPKWITEVGKVLTDAKSWVKDVGDRYRSEELLDIRKNLHTQLDKIHDLQQKTPTTEHGSASKASNLNLHAELLAKVLERKDELEQRQHNAMTPKPTPKEN